MPQTKQAETKQLPTLYVRAAVRPSSVDAEKRTAELIVTTDAPVQRHGWDGPFLEVLSMDASAVDLSRMNSGAPLLNAHNAYDLGAVIGVVERAWIKGNELRATVRFSERAEVEPIFQDVRAGVLRNVSVGYSVEKFELVSGGDDDIPTYKATRWTPMEASLVPIGADPSAQVKGQRGEDARRWPCRIIQSQGVTDMPEELAGAGEQGAVAIERARVLGIQKAVRVAKLPDALASEMIEKGTPLEEARNAILGKIADAADATPTRSHVSMERDGGDTLREGIKAALFARMNPGSAKATDPGYDLAREYVGIPVLELGRRFLESSGVRTAGLSPMKLAGVLMGNTRIGGMHSTSDFPLLLADVTEKVLRTEYEHSPRTWLPIARRTTARDFKMMKRLQIGEAPGLLKVPEGAEFTRGTLGEGREQFQVATYGRVVALSRQAIVNDDLSAFATIPRQFSRAAAHLESDLVWEQITSNPNMGDGVALFDATAHFNEAAAGAVISVESISAARIAMRHQKGLDGAAILNLRPKFLIVPVALETEAERIVSEKLLAAVVGEVNPIAGRLTLIVEPRLDADSQLAWYLGADPSQIDMLEYAYLDGQEGPYIETREGFNVDGIEIKCRHDFGAKIIDWRGFYMNEGAEPEA